jgi:hypothetical protein
LAAAFSDLTGGATATVGRHFSVLATIPSLLFVGFVALLVRSGAWSGPPDWGAAIESFREAGLRDALILAVASLAVGVAVHPVQFFATQLLEGYWGASRPGIAFAARRTAHHWDRLDALDELAGDHASLLEDQETADASLTVVKEEIDKNEISHNVAWREAERLRFYYPILHSHVMPTRLGNVLKTWEMRAGHQFGLQAIATLPYFALVADPEHRALLDDRRTSLDFAVRVCILGILAAGAAVVFLWGRGLDMLIALLPFLVAYLSYRGSLNVAVEYGIAMSILIALNRERLYRSLALDLPTSLEAERTETAVTVMRLVGPANQRAAGATRLAWSAPPRADPPAPAPPSPSLGSG